MSLRRSRGAGRRRLPRCSITTAPPSRRCRSITPWSRQRCAAAAKPHIECLRRFVERKLERYGEDHNHPDLDGSSRLSPYLHFGHVSAHDVFAAIMTHERWTTRRLGRSAGGAREGWWGVSPSAEMFLDQLLVWRELAFNGSAWTRGFAGYDTLPAWARARSRHHLGDPRPRRYSLEALDRAETHDEVWNAAQQELKTEGWFHGYMRMLWGKKILEWSEHPADALAVMEQLMNRYSLDGRDPVSVCELRVGAWPVRSPVARTPRFRHGPLHDVRQRPAQAEDEVRTSRSMAKQNPLVPVSSDASPF